MNERFKELGMKAGLYVDFNGEPWPRNMNGEDIEGIYQKFAELIVQDCADLVENQGRFFKYDILAKKIKENFGIKK